MPLSELAARTLRHLGQFEVEPGEIKGFVFVDEQWLSDHQADADYQLETDPEVIAWVRDTWIDHHIPGTVGTDFSYSQERRYLVITTFGLMPPSLESRW